MTLKSEERTKSIELRKAGRSIGSIAKELGVAKSSVSVWVRGVPVPITTKSSRVGHPVSTKTRNKISENVKKAWSEGRTKGRSKPTTSPTDAGGLRKCTKCGECYDISHYSKKDYGDGYARWCKRCISEHDSSRLKELRMQVFEKLGGAKCSHCGCDVIGILEINHINGGGRKEYKVVRARKMLKRIMDGTLDAKKYNVLCHVCNHLHYVEVILGIKGHKVTWGV